MISYTISVYNELQEISSLLSRLRDIVTEHDEIVVVQTYREQYEITQDLFLNIQKICLEYAHTYQTFHFQNRFADLKNYMNSLAQKAYIINIDADELVSIETAKLWKQTIKEQPSDLYYVPRINTVTGYSLQDVKNYGWNINSHGWINWPDYQPRIFKNTSEISWIGDVHETIHGTNKALALPSDPRMAIIHHKDINRQREQNTLYHHISQKSG